MSWRRDCVKLWGIFSLILGILVLPQSFAQDDSASQLRDEAIAHYRNWMNYGQNADLDQAIRKFNEFLLLRPSDKEALDLREQAGKDMMLHMMMYGEKTGGETARIARAILLYAEKRPAIRMENNAEQIKKIVNLVATGNLAQRYEAMTLLKTQVGELAIPEMLPYLQEKDERKIQIFLAITKMGRTAAVPLIEALNSQNKELRQQVVILLGHIGDIRALPDLKRLLENPKEEGEVKQYVKIAIKRIANKPAISLPSAKELYYQKALAHYRNKKEYKPIISFKQRLCWRWESEKLVYKEVASFVYNEVMAEHACFHALAIDATMTKVWALLARVYYSEYTKVTVLKNAYTEKEEGIPEDIEQEIEKEIEYTDKAKEIVAACGPEILYEALSAALRENRPEVTVAILENIGESSRGRGDVPTPIIKAIRSKDRKIRYMAAEALVKISPKRRFSDASRVVETLQEALSKWESQAVLVIEDDDASRNELLQIIRGMNKTAFEATRVSEGLKRAKMAPPDLIIISTELKNLDFSFQYMFNAFQEDDRTKDIPMLLVTPQDKVEQRTLYKEKSDVVVDILVKGSGSPLFSHSMVQNAVATALQKSEKIGRSYHRKTKEEIAIRAVKTLASIAADSKIFKLELASGELLKLLDRKNEIRIPAIIALGNLGERAAKPKLEDILEKDEDVEVRILSTWALGQIFNKTRMEVDAVNAERLVKILKSVENDFAELQDNPEKANRYKLLKSRLFYLLGQANITPEDRLAIFSKYRVHARISEFVEKTSGEDEAFFGETVPEKQGDDEAGDDDDENWDDDDSADDDDDNSADDDDDNSADDDDDNSADDDSTDDDSADDDDSW